MIGGVGGLGSKCTEEWTLDQYVVQCMQHKGQAQRFMRTEDIKGDFNLDYRKYDIFTGWTFNGKSEQPLATAFKNVVVDFNLFKAKEEINLKNALAGMTVSALVYGSMIYLI
jgi:hypothetical protein